MEIEKLYFIDKVKIASAPFKILHKTRHILIEF